MFDWLSRAWRLTWHPEQLRSDLLVTAEDLGLRMERGKAANHETLLIDWNRITKIAVFKRDLYGVDQISMIVETTDQGVVEFDESMRGWSRVVEALPLHLQGALSVEQWFANTAFPAFQTLPKLIYEKDSVRSNATVQ